MKMKKHKLEHFSVTNALSVLDEESKIMMPESLSQPKAFALLMPQILVLREKKLSFNQIADLLTKVGFTLEAVSVR